MNLDWLLFGVIVYTALMLRPMGPDAVGVALRRVHKK